MTIKVCYDQAHLVSEFDIAVPIKANGVQIGIIGIQRFGDGVAGFYIEAPPSAYGFANTNCDILKVTDDIVLGHARRLAKAFGVADEIGIEIEHEEKHQ